MQPFEAAATPRAACGLLLWILGTPLFAAPPAEPGTARVDPLVFFRDAAGVSQGGVMPLAITVGGGKPGQMRIGFFESEVGGSGTQWRAAGWNAAVTAAQLTGFHPLCLQVAYDVQGRINGPSAGALMTVGLLAAVQGHEVRPEATMTGTMLPDGTIGPVGGIVQKIEGAARAGKKLVLIPAGMRTQVDANQGRAVDLIEHGRKLGVEVRPTLDIYTAYAALVGQALPRPPAAVVPPVSDEIRQQIAAKTTRWLERHRTARKKYQELASTGRAAEFDELLAQGVQRAEQAAKLTAEGAVEAAYCDALDAAVHGYVAMEAGRCRFTYATRALAGAAARARNNGWVQEEVDRLSAALRFFRPETIDQLTMYLLACDAFVEAVSLQQLAIRALAALPAEEEPALETVAVAALWQVVAWLDLLAAEDYLELAAGFRGQPLPADAPFAQTTGFYSRAADANQAVFESLVIDNLAKQIGRTPDQARRALAAKDESYALLRALGEEAAPRLEQYFGTGPNRQYAALAVSLSAYLQGTLLLAKYDALDVQLDSEMQIKSVGRERTLVEWLAFAEDQAARNIGALREAGVDATAAALLYRAARVQRGRDLEGKLESLGHFLHANIHCAVLRRLTGAGLVGGK